MRTWLRCDMGLTIQFFFIVWEISPFCGVLFIQSENHLLSYSITLQAMLTE